MFNMFGVFSQQQSKPVDIKDDLRYNQAQSDMLVLLANQVSSRLDTTNIMLYDTIHNIATIMKETGQEVYIYDNVKFSIDFLGLVNVELTH
jgi:hypothetical protein